jgi:hypothetical protein
MSAENQVNPGKIAKLTQDIVKILSNEDSTTRQRAIQAALTVLGEAPILPAHKSPQINTPDDSTDQDDIGAFFKRDGKLKPSDTAFLCAAFHYSVHGPVAFGIDEIRQIAADAGEIIPDRVDNTFRAAAKKGKNLFQMVGKRSFKPTASGAAFFKEEWSVKPGKKLKVVANSKE